MVRFMWQKAQELHSHRAHMFLHVLLQAQTVTKILKCNYVLCLLVCLGCFLGSIGIPVVSLVRVAHYEGSFHSTHPEEKK